jgi:hypothetical protein
LTNEPKHDEAIVFRADRQRLLEGKNPDVRWMRGLASGKRRGLIAGMRQTRTFFFGGISVLIVLAAFYLIPLLTGQDTAIGGARFSLEARIIDGRTEFAVVAAPSSDSAFSKGYFDLIVTGGGQAFETTVFIDESGARATGALSAIARELHAIVTFAGETLALSVAPSEEGK